MIWSVVIALALVGLMALVLLLAVSCIWIGARADERTEIAMREYKRSDHDG